MNKLINVVRRDGLLYTLRRSLAWGLGHTPLGSSFSFRFYHDKRLCFAPSMLTYVLFADPTSRQADTAVIERYVPTGGVVVDVGAHIGSTAIVAATTAGPTGTVLAIEASPRFFSILKQNITLNHLGSQVTCLPYALGDTLGTVHLNESVSDDTTNHIAESGTAVQQTTLDAVTSHLDHIEFLKIDVEGYEPKVLAGATKTLQKTRCVYIEFNTANLEHLGYSPRSIIDSLTPSFNLYEVAGHSLRPFTFLANTPYNTDLLCLNQ